MNRRPESDFTVQRMLGKNQQVRRDRSRSEFDRESAHPMRPAIISDISSLEDEDHDAGAEAQAGSYSDRSPQEKK